MQEAARFQVTYAALGRIAPSPVVELNRAVAVSRAHGPEAALAIVDALGDALAVPPAPERPRRPAREARAALLRRRDALQAPHSPAQAIGSTPTSAQLRS